MYCFSNWMYWIWTKTRRLTSCNVGINLWCDHDLIDGGTMWDRHHFKCFSSPTDSSLCASVLFYPFRRPRGVISTPVIRTFGRGGRYYGRGYKNQGVIQVIHSSGRHRGSLRARSSGFVLWCLCPDGGAGVFLPRASATVVVRGACWLWLLSPVGLAVGSVLKSMVSWSQLHGECSRAVSGVFVLKHSSGK